MELRAMEAYKKKIVINHACFCLATMLASKTITEITEKIFEFSECVNSCINFFQFSVDKPCNYL